MATTTKFINKREHKNNGTISLNVKNLSALLYVWKATQKLQ